MKRKVTRIHDSTHMDTKCSVSYCCCYVQHRRWISHDDYVITKIMGICSNGKYRVTVVNLPVQNLHDISIITYFQPHHDKMYLISTPSQHC